MKLTGTLELLDHLEKADVLDPAATWLRKAARATVRPQWLRDALHGVPFGHPLHPVAAQVPVGAWTSAAVLDLVPGAERASAILVGTGLAAAAPAVISGATDLSELHEQQQRVGVVHASANAAATCLYALSLAQRLRGKHVSGKLLGYAGFGVATAGAFLGGHLAYHQAAGANHAEEVPHRTPPGWHSIGRLEEFTDGKPQQVMLDTVPLFVLRQGDEVQVLADACSHLAGPLHEGKISRQQVSGRAEDCVQCPWHGSTFSLRTGEVVTGPASAGQPVFQSRVVDGVVEARLPGAG
ncbi:Rieske 2Fe-2S domain-containing protein [Paenarthrobacter sp. DKR-5]|uniref:Rieske 2Fe-2S domain-containing protein n=1 Tax=Paenarthrobacter sp. DKR-5 TaxID=2835535 RepID=UPI001BDCD4DD|nr:Rieske 2Fe-2S domain-containing protein [Paenarthrobacter sp. DKR-5]MBT1001381.1 Rieske 2Fe-2S domain-containing protein [Paenarthrobacter sp. DKR-5]